MGNGASNIDCAGAVSGTNPHRPATSRNGPAAHGHTYPSGAPRADNASARQTNEQQAYKAKQHRAQEQRRLYHLQLQRDIQEQQHQVQLQILQRQVEQRTTQLVELQRVRERHQKLEQEVQVVQQQQQKRLEELQAQHRKRQQQLAEQPDSPQRLPPAHVMEDVKNNLYSNPPSQPTHTEHTATTTTLATVPSEQTTNRPTATDRDTCFSYGYQSFIAQCEGGEGKHAHGPSSSHAPPKAESPRSQTNAAHSASSQLPPIPAAVRSTTMRRPESPSRAERTREDSCVGNYYFLYADSVRRELGPDAASHARRGSRRDTVTTDGPTAVRRRRSRTKRSSHDNAAVAPAAPMTATDSLSSSINELPRTTHLRAAQWRRMVGVVSGMVGSRRHSRVPEPDLDAHSNVFDAYSTLGSFYHAASSTRRPTMSVAGGMSDVYASMSRSSDDGVPTSHADSNPVAGASNGSTGDSLGPTPQQRPNERHASINFMSHIANWNRGLSPTRAARSTQGKLRRRDSLDDDSDESDGDDAEMVSADDEEYDEEYEEEEYEEDDEEGSELYVESDEEAEPNHYVAFNHGNSSPGTLPRHALGYHHVQQQRHVVRPERRPNAVLMAAHRPRLLPHHVTHAGYAPQTMPTAAAATQSGMGQGAGPSFLPPPAVRPSRVPHPQPAVFGPRLQRRYAVNYEQMFGFSLRSCPWVRSPPWQALAVLDK